MNTPTEKIAADAVKRMHSTVFCPYPWMPDPWDPRKLADGKRRPVVGIKRKIQERVERKTQDVSL